MMIKYIAYPGNRPPEIVELPEDYDFRGHSWAYKIATKRSAFLAVKNHQEEWPEHTIDPELLNMLSD